MQELRLAISFMGEHRQSSRQLESKMNERPKNVMDLFSGAGGSILAGQFNNHRTIVAVEIDPYCREVLLRRQEEGHIEAFPIWDDIDTFDATEWHGIVDVISAGFPCQGFSVAGKQRGAADPRNKWPETKRVIEEVRPSGVILENVPGIRKYVQVVARDLADLGYDCKWGVISAREAGALHLRKRWYCLAHPHRQRES